MYLEATELVSASRQGELILQVLSSLSINFHIETYRDLIAIIVNRPSLENSLTFPS